MNEVTIDDLEMTSLEYPVRWEGNDSEGRYVHIRYRFWRLTVEIADRIQMKLKLSEGHPGATEHTLSNAGLKQALMGCEPTIYFPF